MLKRYNHSAQGPPRGFTLLETLIALSVVAVALMGILSAIAALVRLTESNHDQFIAVNIARQKLAEIQNAPFQTAFALYGPGSSYNSGTFKQLDSGVCKYVFPVGAGGKLDETRVDADLGMPQDLNNNGNATDTDVSSTYSLLPVRIHVTWDTPSGQRELNLNTMLTRLK